nr:hypothetical protein [Novosphingobium panipatense]
MGRLVARLFERQRHLAPLLVGLLGRRLDRLKRRFNPKRLKALEHLGANRLIDAQRTEADARVGPMVDEGTATVIAARIAVAAGITSNLRDNLFSSRSSRYKTTWGNRGRRVTPG